MGFGVDQSVGQWAGKSRSFDQQGSLQGQVIEEDYFMIQYMYVDVLMDSFFFFLPRYDFPSETIERFERTALKDIRLVQKGN